TNRFSGKLHSFGITVFPLRFFLSVSFSRFSADLRVAARVSLYILSSPKRIVNTLSQLFSVFWRRFWFLEHSPKTLRMMFQAKSVCFSLHPP
ncbi:MAG: hypothetical protein PUC00_00960, partial [Clostridiales bacterium]|nr:hypothetical protein [Clostridiales bacterium]